MSGLISHKTARLMGNIATVLFAIVIVLQLLLVAGILPVTMFWGSQFSVLTPGLRWGSLGTVVILAAFAYVIRRRAGLLGASPPSTLIKVLAWIVTAYTALNLFLNLVSPSLAETLVFGSITFLLVISCALVALSKSQA